MLRDFDRNDLSDLRRSHTDDEGEGAGAPEIPGYVLQDGGADVSGGEVPHEAYDPSWSTSASSPGAFVPPAGDGAPDGASTTHEKGDSIWKVLAILGAGCLGVNLVVTAITMLVISVGLASCVSSCSDSPIQDSRKNASFISDLTATERDLAVFDALGGAIDALQTKRRTGSDDVPTADELRAQVAAGSWPKDKDERDAWSARVWVRIAELSEDWLEAETDEQWEVADFSYPFPSNVSVPVPAVRNEDSRCLTRLLCLEGEDEGLYTTVAYYRWKKGAPFQSSLDESRDRMAKAEQLDQDIADTGLLGERSYVVSNGDLFVWEQGADDPLRDPEAFLGVSTQLAKLLGDYADIILLVEDTPFVIRYDTLSYGDYPNDRPTETVTFEEGRERLMRADDVFRLDHATGDELLHCACRGSEEPTMQDLTGTLAPIPKGELHHPWRAPSEGCTFDEEMVGKVADLVGTDEDRVIVANNFDTADSMYNSLEVWLIMAGGTMPETPDAFCATCDELRDAFWETIPIDEEKNTQLYLHIFVVNETTLANAEGEAITFAQMREAAQARPADLDGYNVDLLLTTMPFVSQWGGEDPSPDPTRPKDVGGSIARSRDWRYSED